MRESAFFDPSFTSEVTEEALGAIAAGCVDWEDRSHFAALALRAKVLPQRSL